MTTYAIAPKGCSYFTAGKAYEVLNDNEHGFNVVCELGSEEYTLWEGSAHFDGDAKWIKVEINDNAISEPETPASAAETLREILAVLKRIEARSRQHDRGCLDARRLASGPLPHRSRGEG